MCLTKAENMAFYKRTNSNLSENCLSSVAPSRISNGTSQTFHNGGEPVHSHNNMLLIFVNRFTRQNTQNTFSKFFNALAEISLWQFVASKQKPHEKEKMKILNI